MIGVLSKQTRVRDYSDSHGPPIETRGLALAGPEGEETVRLTTPNKDKHASK